MPLRFEDLDEFDLHEFQMAKIIEYHAGPVAKERYLNAQPRRKAIYKSLGLK